MTIAFLEGFDEYPANVNTAGYGLASTWEGNAFIALQTGRFGGQCMFIGDTGIRVRQIPSSTKYAVGFAFNRPAGQFNGYSTRVTFAGLDSSTNKIIGLAISDLGYLSLVRWKVATPTVFDVLATADRPCVVATWHYIEIQFEASGSGVFDLWIDGAHQFTFTGNTFGGVGGTAIGRMIFENQGSYSVDDLYLAYGDDAEIFGESRIQPLSALSDFLKEWTPLTGSANYPMISTSDGDTSYNHTNTPDARDLFGMEQITVNPDQIHAIAVHMAVRKEDSATRTVKTSIQSNLVDGAGLDANLTAQYLWIRSVYQLNPDGDVPWTKSAVNAVKCGYQLVL